MRSIGSLCFFISAALGKRFSRKRRLVLFNEGSHALDLVAVGKAHAEHMRLVHSAGPLIHLKALIDGPLGIADRARTARGDKRQGFDS